MELDDIISRSIPKGFMEGKFVEVAFENVCKLMSEGRTATKNKNVMSKKVDKKQNFTKSYFFVVSINACSSVILLVRILRSCNRESRLRKYDVKNDMPHPINRPAENIIHEDGSDSAIASNVELLPN